MKGHAFSLFLTSLFAVSFLFAAEKKPGRFIPPPGPGGHPVMQGHPMLAALESPEFTPQERERLKRLAMEDPNGFAAEMRKSFHAFRQKKAKEMLALRQAYLAASSPEQKKAALNKIQDAVRKDMEDHLKIRKKWLEYTENMIRQLEKRLTAMRGRYEKQLREKDSIIAKRTEELIAPQPPERLVRDAAGDFRRGRRSAPQKRP